MIKVTYSIYTSEMLAAKETHGITQTVQNLVEMKNELGSDLSVKFNLQIDDNPEIGPWSFAIENAIVFLVKLKNKKKIKTGKFKKNGNHIEYEEG